MTLNKTIANINDITQQQAARIAGFGLLLMFISGLIANGPEVPMNLDEITAQNSTLRMNMVGDVLMIVFDVVAALGLYVLLKPVNRSISLLAAWFRLMHVAIYGAVLLNLLLIVFLYSNADGLSIFSPDEVQAHAQLFVNMYEFGFLTGLVFFGFHFLILGYLIIKSEYLPKILGILLLIASVGYLINSFSAFLMPDYEEFKPIIQKVVFIPAIVAELSLCLWLLIRAKKIPEIEMS